MSWIYLLIASIFEVGWPFGFKMASITSYKVFWIIFAIITMTLSGFFLYIAQKQIPIGAAYAVWTGIGATCTFLIGVIQRCNQFDENIWGITNHSRRNLLKME